MFGDQSLISDHAATIPWNNHCPCFGDYHTTFGMKFIGRMKLTEFQMPPTLSVGFYFVVIYEMLKSLVI